MKKVMDKLLNTVRFDKKYVFFSLIIVILGILTGSIFVVILKNSDKTIVIEYIESFIDNIKNGNINYLDVFKNTMIINYASIIIICLIGFTFILFPINILLLYYKSFLVGFSLSSFILTYKLKGLIISTIYIFPHLIINIIVFSILTAYTAKLSLYMIKSIIKKKNIDIRNYFNKYMYVTMLMALFITITSAYEAFISNFLLKYISNIII